MVLLLLALPCNKLSPKPTFFPFELKATVASRTGSRPLRLMFKYRFALILPVLLLINEDVSQGLSLGLI